MSRYDRNHRSSTDIIVSILEFVDSRGATLKTHILYGANLNSKSLEKFLTKLISTGLLMKTQEDGKDKYFITARGRIFLHHMGRALNMLRDNKEVSVNRNLKERLRTHETPVKVKEGLVCKGSSGVHYVLPVAFIVNKSGEEEIAAVMEIINSEMTPKEAISIVAWTWTVTKDMGITSLLLVDESHLDTVTKVAETLRESERNRIVILRYGRYESPEAIARKVANELMKKVLISA
ncbi:MAG: hypothetical protein J7L55_03915 [Desulfurococcales archaeon]|nr:hypothetical protein [Desulfurococcales archaeon]